MLRLPISLHLTPLPPSSLKGFLLGSPVQEGMSLELGLKKEIEHVQNDGYTFLMGWAL